jgi:response regulator RpfG family c-di-GMP phosphodiesterase
MTKNNVYTVLIVEDEERFRDIYGDRLMADGYKVKMAQNGNEALKVLESGEVDLIMTDIVMPSMDGREFVKTIKSKTVWKNIPILVLSVMGDRESIQELTDLGVTDYTVKGMFTPLDISKKIADILEKNKGTDNRSKKYLLKIMPDRLDAVMFFRDHSLAEEGSCQLELIKDSAHEGWFEAHLIKCDE